MTEKKRFQCLNCGCQFEEEVLTFEEQRKAREEYRPTRSVHCPKCNRTDIRKE